MLYVLSIFYKKILFNFKMSCFIQCVTGYLFVKFTRVFLFSVKSNFKKYKKKLFLKEISKQEKNVLIMLLNRVFKSYLNVYFMVG